MCKLSFLVFLTGRLRAVARASGEAASVRALLAALPLTRGTRASNFVPAQFFAFFPADFRAKERLLAVYLTDVRRESLRSQIKRNGLKMDVSSPGLSRFASFPPSPAPLFSSSFREMRWRLGRSQLGGMLKRITTVNGAFSNMVKSKKFCLHGKRGFILSCFTVQSFCDETDKNPEKSRIFQSCD